MNQQRPRFIRRNGRIIPIREKRKDQAAIGVGVASAAVAADAARTKTVYKTKSLTIERKNFSFMPMDSYQSKSPKFGSALLAKNSQGKRVGRLHYTTGGKEGVIDWLSVKKSERGKGISKKLAKQGAIEMKQKGAKGLFTHVVHPRSAVLLDGEKGVRSQYWRISRTTKKSGSFFESIGKKEALEKVSKWRGKPGKFKLSDVGAVVKESAKSMLATKPKYDYAGPTIYRQVSFPKKMRRQIKPFRTTRNKFQLGLGLLGAAGSFAYAARGKNEE